MNKCYHINCEQLTNLIKEHIAKKGEVVSKVEFKVAGGANSWTGMASNPYLQEVIVFLKEGNENGSEQSDRP